MYDSFILQDGSRRVRTWKQECCDDCADYVWGTGCGWIVDHDDVEEFKLFGRNTRNSLNNIRPKGDQMITFLRSVLFTFLVF